MEYTKEEKNVWKEKFHKIDRLIYQGQMYTHTFDVGGILGYMGQRDLIRKFKSSFDNVSDEPNANELNELLKSVNSQYRIFTYNEGIELWTLVKS